MFLDSSKAHAQLGWRPHLDTETSLDWTMAWYRHWNEKNDMSDFTYNQIENYQKLLERNATVSALSR